MQCVFKGEVYTLGSSEVRQQCQSKEGACEHQSPATVPVLLEQYGMDSANYDRSTWYAIIKMIL